MNIDATEIMVIASMSDGSFDCVEDLYENESEAKKEACKVMKDMFKCSDCPDFDPMSNWG